MSAKPKKGQTSPRVKEILETIPEEIRMKKQTKDRLGDIIAQISTRDVPVNAMSRLWTLGSMQAKIAAGYLSYAIRSNFVSTTEKQRLLNERNLNTALRLFGTMGYMRGVMIKVGQVLGNMPRVVPNEIAEIMESLHFEAPPMHYSMIREVVLDELGKDPEEVFASFEKQAFAAASLGQVHMARLKTGEEVAVKIQYPNMIRTIRADLKSLRILLQPMRLRKEQKFIIDHLKDAERMLTAEADYTKEAKFMKKAGEQFTEGDQIIIPQVWDRYSSERVLTMDYLPGVHLREFLSSGPDQKKRDHYGNLISRAFLRIWFQNRTLYTDLNPGNFLFLEGGRLGMIDFGSQRTFSEVQWKEQCSHEKATLEQDDITINIGIAKLSLFEKVSDVEPERLALIRSLGSWQAEPVMKENPFDFGSEEFFQRGIDLYADTARRGYSRYESVYNWWSRAVVGHRILMYRLGSRSDYRKIYMEERKALTARDKLCIANYDLPA